MATTKIWDVRGWLGKLVIYAQNPEKTLNPACFQKQEMSGEEVQGLSDVIDYAMRADKTTEGEKEPETMRQYVSGINCLPATARDEMMTVKKHFDKEGGIVAFHAYQSFAPGEVTPALAHQIGRQLAQELWGDRFQVLVATHLDKASHIHTHFVINSVSFQDGRRYNDCLATYMELRKASDRICLEHGLSVIENPKRGKSKQYGEWRADKEGSPTWRGLVRADVDAVIAQAVTDRQFFALLRAKGYDVKQGKDISVRPPGKERFVRLARNFGEEYAIDAIRRRILAHGLPRKTQLQRTPDIQIFRFKGSITKARKLGGLRGVYLVYCFRLGILPKREIPPARLHFLLREDLRKMDAISAETKLLVRCKIDTAGQLSSYMEQTQESINGLRNQRTKLRNHLRTADEKDRSGIRTKIAAISKQLGGLRKEVRLCESIAQRSGVLKEKLEKARQDEMSNREENGYEYGRGCGGTDRPAVPRWR